MTSRVRGQIDLPAGSISFRGLSWDQLEIVERVLAALEALPEGEGGPGAVGFDIVPAPGNSSASLGVQLTHYSPQGEVAVCAAVRG